MVQCFEQFRSRGLIVGGLVAMVVASWAAASSAADIALRPQAAPVTTVVRLGDVADVRAESGHEVERLSALPLMPAPASGTQRYLRMREVQDLLAAHGEDMSRLNFRGETVIEVASPSAVDLPADDDQGAVREQRRTAWLGTSSAGSGERGVRSQQQREGSADSLLPAAHSSLLRDELCRIIVEHLNRHAGANAQWHVEPAVSQRHLQTLSLATSPPTCAGGKPPWTGEQRFIVAFPTSRGDARFAVTAEVTRPQPVVVAIRPIERGAVITASHVELQQRDDLPLASGSRVPMDSVERLLGMEAARPIQVGHVILSDDVRAPLLVKRGDGVTVYARGGGIQVRTLARARQDGARGELLQVESLDTRERYDAVVVGPREAVVFGGNTAPTAGVAERPFQLPRR